MSEPRSNESASSHHFRQQFRGYFGRLLWVARDALPHFRGRVWLIILLNIFGLSTAAASLGGIVLYAKHAETHQPIKLLGQSYQFNGDIPTLLFYGGALAVLGILSGASLYSAEWLIQRTTRRYEQICMQRVLHIISEPMKRGWQHLVEGTPRDAINRMLGLGSRWTAFAFGEMLRGMLPVLTFMVTMSVLVYINVKLTLLLMPFAAAYLVPLYLINRRVSKTQKRYRESSQVFRSELSRGICKVLDASPLPQHKARWGDDVLQRRDYERMMSAFYGRMIADKRVQFLNTCFFVVCLLLLFVFFGIEARSADLSRNPWAEMLAYLFALRFAISALRQVTSMFVKFSRFLPEYRAFSQFIQKTDRMKARRIARRKNTPDLTENLALFFETDGRWESVNTVTFRKSQVLWILTPLRPWHFELEAIATALGSAIKPAIDLASHAEFAAGSWMNPEWTLQENAVGSAPADEDVRRLQEFLDRLGVLAEIENLPRGLHTPASNADDQLLSAEAKYALQHSHALGGAHDFVLLAADPLVGLERGFVERVLHSLERGYTVLVHHRPEPVFGSTLKIPSERLASVLVMDDRQIIAAGDMNWLKRHETKIKRAIRAGSSRSSQDMDETGESAEEGLLE